MNKSLILLTALATTAFAVPSFAADSASTTTETKVNGDTDGNYDKQTTYEHKDTAGTKTTHKVEAKVKTDSKGDVTKTVDTENSTDPKGLMNKTSTTSHTKVEKNADGSTIVHHKKKVNGDTVVDEKMESNTAN